MLKCIKNRNRLQKQSQQNKENETLSLIYKRYRNVCNNLLKKHKRKYEQDLLLKAKNNNKLLWNAVKNITHLNNKKSNNQDLRQLADTPQNSANLINNHFLNVGKALAEDIIAQQLPQSYFELLPSPQPNSIGFIEPDTNEIESIITNLKSDSASGWDNIPTKFVKLAKTELAPIINHLCVLCSNRGVFPQSLKRAIVHPIYKSGARDDINNYRPISVLTVISKIIEKNINKRLLDFINKYNILSDAQFGFREKRSIEDAILTLTGNIVDILDSSEKAVCFCVY